MRRKQSFSGGVASSIAVFVLTVSAILLLTNLTRSSASATAAEPEPARAEEQAYKPEPAQVTAVVYGEEKPSILLPALAAFFLITIPVIGFLYIKKRQYEHPNVPIAKGRKYSPKAEKTFKKLTTYEIRVRK